MLPLRYLGYTIALQEVPNEISLAFNISGCPHQCNGCHSQYLWKYSGNLLIDDIERILDEYYQYITCVCFMGGDQNIIELEELCQFVKDKYQLKIAIYSGCDDICIFKNIVQNKIVDYLKIGRYIKEYGGLNNTKTNQKVYKIKYINNNPQYEDITSLFFKRKD